MKRKSLNRFYIYLLISSHFYTHAIKFTVASCNILAQKFYEEHAEKAQKLSHNPEKVQKLSFVNRKQFFLQAFKADQQFKNVDIICIQEWDPSGIAQDISKIKEFYNVYTISNESPGVAILIHRETCELLNTQIITLNNQKRALRAEIRLILAPSDYPSISVTSCHIPQEPYKQQDLQLSYIDQVINDSKPDRSKPIIICGDFNYHTAFFVSEPDKDNSPFKKLTDFVSELNKDNSPYKKLIEKFIPNSWVDAALQVAQENNIDLAPTVYATKGFSRIDYIFFTPRPAPPSLEWSLELEKYAVYPADKKLLIKHSKAPGYTFLKDGPLYSDYFSDHALLKATFELTVDSPDNQLKQLWSQLTNLHYFLR